MDMNTGRDELDVFVDAAANVLDIPIDPTWKPAVRENLSVIFAHARRFADFPLPDEAESAPIFRA